jgi:aminopeptidase N
MAVKYFGSSKGTEFSVWSFPEDADDAFKALAPKTASVFEFFSDHIGHYSFEKLAHLEAIGGGGATEPASTIFYFNGSYGAESHEMAHHWFGDAVTERDWDDVWLSEGFATYFALLYTEHADGRDAFLAGVKRARDAAMRYELAHPADTVVHDNLDNDSNVFFNSSQIYQGGAMVLHTLRGVLGDGTFWAGIRLYYSRFQNQSASTDDLRHAMEDACFAAGNCPQDHRDLGWLFHEWLNRGGILQVKGTWRYDAAAKLLHVRISQTQTQGLYRMPVELGIQLPAPSTTATGSNRPSSAPAIQKTTILLDKADNTLDIPLDTAPADVLLDPDTWVPMMQATFAAE